MLKGAKRVGFSLQYLSFSVVDFDKVLAISLHSSIFESNITNIMHIDQALYLH